MQNSNILKNVCSFCIDQDSQSHDIRFRDTILDYQSNDL